MLDLRNTVRVTLGSYVAVHFAALLPWATEVFSSRGMLPEGTASPLLHAFPNVLALCDSPSAVVALVLVGAIAGVGLAAGRLERVAAALALFVSACLFGRNPLIANPAMPYIGLLLFAWAASPKRQDTTA